MIMHFKYIIMMLVDISSMNGPIANALNNHEFDYNVLK
jgi:hypothetical protein